MSTVYQGNAANITPPTALTITNVTNAVPAIVTVSGTLPAAFLSGVTVDITNVQGATGANGIWQDCIPTGVSTFALPNVSPPGVYTTGGSAQPIYLQGTTIPADGDVRSASSVNVPFEGLSDQMAFLLVATGQYKIAHYFSFGFTNDFITLGTMPAGVAPGSAGDWTGSIASFQPFIIDLGGISGALPVVANDIAVMSFTSNLKWGTTNSIAAAANLWYANYTPPNASPTFVQASGPSAEFFLGVSPPVGGQKCSPFTVKADQTIATTGLFDFKIRFVVGGGTTTSSGDVNLDGGFHVSCILLRPTSSPQ